jgi:transposase
VSTKTGEDHVLDNHSAHISKETRKYLANVPNRFEFVHTPTHGSWLNLIESFFAKMTNTFLRGIRVHSKAELVRRIEQYLTELNQTPVVFHWKYGLTSIVVVEQAA